MREESDNALDQVRKKFGAIDVLVNSAGTICVGPLEVMTIDDFRASLNAHFWRPYFTTMAVMEEMESRKRGRIVNVSSIGAKNQRAASVAILRWEICPDGLFEKTAIGAA